MRSYIYWFLNILCFKGFIYVSNIYNKTYINKISEPVVFILLNIAMFVVKLTDLIPENKSVNGRFLRN